MRLPSFRRLYEQDYPPENQSLIQQLAGSVNSGFEPLYELLNGKLTFSDNTSSLISTINIEVNASGKPKTRTTIRKETPERFSGFTVIKASNLTNSNTYPTSTPFLTYTETATAIIIDHVVGLPADNLFQITVFGIK